MLQTWRCTVTMMLYMCCTNRGIVRPVIACVALQGAVNEAGDAYSAAQQGPPHARYPALVWTRAHQTELEERTACASTELKVHMQAASLLHQHGLRFGKEVIGNCYRCIRKCKEHELISDETYKEWDAARDDGNSAKHTHFQPSSHWVSTMPVGQKGFQATSRRLAASGPNNGPSAIFSAAPAADLSVGTVYGDAPLPTTLSDMGAAGGMLLNKNAAQSLPQSEFKVVCKRVKQLISAHKLHDVFLWGCAAACSFTAVCMLFVIQL